MDFWQCSRPAARQDKDHVLGGFGQDGVSHVATAGNGDIAVTGTQMDRELRLRWRASTGCRAFVVRYGPDGNCRFSKSYGQLGWNGAGGVAFAPWGGSRGGRRFRGTPRFGGGQTVSHCAQIACNDGFL